MRSVRAALPFEGRRENLAQAGKLSRTHAMLVEALNRHRGKGQQKIIVERVNVAAGGQAIVGNIKYEGEGLSKKVEIKPKQLPIHQAQRCGARTRSGKPCRSPAMPNGCCRMHGGLSPGAPQGNRNALKHGLFTAEAIEHRRTLRSLMKVSRRLALEVVGN